MEKVWAQTIWWVTRNDKKKLWEIDIFSLIYNTTLYTSNTVDVLVSDWVSGLMIKGCKCKCGSVFSFVSKHWSVSSCLCFCGYCVS